MCVWGELNWCDFYKHRNFTFLANIYIVDKKHPEEAANTGLCFGSDILHLWKQVHCGNILEKMKLMPDNLWSYLSVVLKEWQLLSLQLF